MAHDHAHHHHEHYGHGDNHARLCLALGLTVGFMVVEAVAGWFTGSLALLADAGHMMSDSSALGVALVASHIARRPPDDRRTLGWRRAEVLAAVINATLLLVIALFIVMEGIERLGGRREITAGPMLVVAVVGLGFNLFNAWMLARGDHDDLNLRAALWHVVGDALGSVGAIVAAVLILAFGWTQADPVVSFVIAVIISVGASRVLKEATDVLMQAAPTGVDLDQVRTALVKDEGVHEIHHLHLWSMAPGCHVLSVHVVLREGNGAEEVRSRLDRRLRHMLALEHLTIQIEPQGGECCHSPAATAP